MRRFGRIVVLLVAGLGVLLVAMCAIGSGQFLLIEGLAHGVTGWVRFLGRTLPEVQPDPLVLLESAVVVALLLGGLQWFGRWLAAERGWSTWSWGRSAGVLAAVLLLFTTSIASAGIAHQLAWLSRDGLSQTRWRPPPDPFSVLDAACRRADWALGVDGLATEISQDASGFDVDRFHYWLLEHDEDDRRLLFVFPRSPALQAEVGGQKCLEVGTAPHAIPVPPDELVEHIADPWIGTY